MNSCRPGAISFDFYEQGFLFIESNQISQHMTDVYQKMNDYIAFTPYNSLDMVQSELERLQYSTDLRMGLIGIKS